MHPFSVPPRPQAAHHHPKPNHNQKQKRFLFLCIQELPHKGLELLTCTGKGDQSEGKVMGRGKGPVWTYLWPECSWTILDQGAQGKSGPRGHALPNAFHVHEVVQTPQVPCWGQRLCLSIVVAVLVMKPCSPALVTPWTVACLDPLSTGFPKQEYWSGLPFPSPGDLSHPGIESPSPYWHLLIPAKPPGKPSLIRIFPQSSMLFGS